MHPTRQRGNLDLLQQTLAGRIIIEGNRVRGVEIVREGVRETVWAEREIILCGGTVNSPQLLMLTGIGLADHLYQLGIPVVSICLRSAAIWRTIRLIHCAMPARSR